MDKKIKIGFQHPIDRGVSDKITPETNRQRYSKASYQMFKKSLFYKKRN